MPVAGMAGLPSRTWGRLFTVPLWAVAVLTAVLFPFLSLFLGGVAQEGYGVMVLNPNENYLEVEKPERPAPEESPDGPEEPAEKRERKEEKEGKKKRDFYEKYRKPQKEKQTEQIPIRVRAGPWLWGMLGVCMRV